MNPSIKLAEFNSLFDSRFSMHSHLSISPAPAYARHRSVLTVTQARYIYGMHHLASNVASTPNLLGCEISNSVLMAAQYGVSPKTIRDIWNRKSWAHSTADLFERDKGHTINLSNLQCLDLKVWAAVCSFSLVFCLLILN